MGLLSAMHALATDWDGVERDLPPEQVGRLRELVAEFGIEATARAAERIMDLLVEWLPVGHPVLRALAGPRSRSGRGADQEAGREWAQLAESLRRQAGPPGTTFDDDDDDA